MSALRTTGKVFLAFALLCSVAWGALPIDLEVAAMQDAPFGAMQQWAPLLGQMDLGSVRLRGFHAGDKPAIEAVSAGSAMRYRILAVLNRDDQLVLPGGRFGQGDKARLKEFFAELPRREEEKHIERGLFGLTKPQFAQIFADLEPPVEQLTQGAAPQSLVAALAAGFRTPLEYEGDAQTELAAAPPLTGELRGLSTGTVLAAALRNAKLALAPQLEGERVTFRIRAPDPAVAAWPVGWKPERVDRQVAPGMYRVTMIEIEGYTLAAAIEALGPHMGVPLVFDERILRERKIDPATKKVKFPRGKSSLRRAFDMCLSQGSLAGELRVDEAGKGFYWITQWGPDSKRAE